MKSKEWDLNLCSLSGLGAGAIVLICFRYIKNYIIRVELRAQPETSKREAF